MLKVCKRLNCTHRTRHESGICEYCRASERLKARRDDERALRGAEKRSDPISDMFLYGRR